MPTHRPANALEDLALSLHSFKLLFILCSKCFGIGSTCLIKLSACSAPLAPPRQSQHPLSPADEHCPRRGAFLTCALADGRNLAEDQRELSVNDKIIVLPGCTQL